MATKPPHFKIAVSGDLGSGKSTVCRLLRENLGYQLFSMGEAWRKLAEKYHMTILELNKYSETHPLDEEMDQAMAEMADTLENKIFDSRLAWHFIPRSFKIHLIVDINIAALRVLNDKRGEAEGYTSLEEARDKILQRKISECNRYLLKYGIDCSNLENYDLVIDTSYATPASIAALIIETLQLWEKGLTFHKLWFSPKTLIPTRGVDVLTHGEVKENEPLHILVARKSNRYYILSGHELVSAAILNGDSFVPARITGEEDGILRRSIMAGKLDDNLDPDLIGKWQEFHRFQYPGL
jgi:cytidylate kinase